MVLGRRAKLEPQDAAECAGLRCAPARVEPVGMATLEELRGQRNATHAVTNYPAAIFTAVPLTDTIIIPFASPSTS